ncbi:DedA family protein [Corynebacterium poyangense]|uniref:DedA family protein n=1 Tax=Corynebacterium poyangense TaxID=2684405 RepID=A0A7H0SMS2_9CORY|nr:VTT domain-containing protein [Corynebacterium poyangense]MBZ8176324.1 DedA family protein [Corynebacterium poyangense]QNQ89847.1 DedA family protein [Corynebacterium poyangense]
MANDVVWTVALGPQWLDPMYLLSGSGPFGGAILPVLFLIVFIESGLLFPLLPGDSLLFTAGLLANQPDPFAPLWLVMILCPIAAILGDQVGYWIGNRFHPHLRNRPDGRIFKQEYVRRTEEFFDKYGPLTIILCRFVPIVRTYAPLVAGMAGMKWRTFITYNIIGGVLWGAGVVALGALLGQITFVRENIEAIFLLIVFISIIPGIIGGIRGMMNKENSKPSQP